MAIPSAFSWDRKTLHESEFVYQIFVGSNLKMVQSRGRICSRRPLKERENFSTRNMVNCFLYVLLMLFPDFSGFSLNFLKIIHVNTLFPVFFKIYFLLLFHSVSFPASISILSAFRKPDI